MPNNETTTKFKVDISDLKKAMQEAKREVALANSEFKAVSSSMDDWSKSSDGISAKLKQLDSNLNSQKTTLKSLEAQYEDVVRTQGEGSKAAQDLAIKINNQKATINNTQKEMSKFEEALEEVTEAEKKAVKTGKSVADVLDDMADSSDDAEDGFTILKGTIATFTGNVLTGLANGLKDTASNLLGLAESTREYRSEMAKLESASANAGYSTEYAKEKYMDLYGVLADETASNTAISNLMAMGTSQETLDSLLNSSIGIWAKYGDSISLDGLAEAINHTSQLGSVQGNLADALEWSGVNVDDFNAQLEACNSEQERQELIANTLDGLYGDLSKSYQETNASVIEANKSNAEYTDTVAEFGEKVEPVTSAVRQGFTDLLAKVLELIGDGDLSAWTDKVEDAFSVVIDEVLPAIKSGFQWIMDNKAPLLAGISAIATGMLAWNVVSIIQGVVGAIKTWKTTTEGMTLAQKLLNTAMASNPIGLIVTLLAGLVAAFITLWNTSDEFRAFWINLFEKLKSTVSSVVTSVTGFFSGLWSKITEGGKKAWEGIKSVFSSVGSFFSETFSSAWEKVKGVFSTGGKIFDGIKEGIVSTFKTVVNGLIKGINKVVSAPFKAINKMLNKIRSIEILEMKPFKGLWDKNPISVPEIPLLALAKGGVTKGLTRAIIGEDGQEAVLPLEKNTGWMRVLARDLVAEMGGTTVNGGTVRGGVVNNFYQTNNSPKALNRLEIYRQSKNLLGYAGGV